MKNLILQAAKFIGFSGIGWVLDICVYAGLGLISSNLDLNNSVSSWVGVTFVFTFATRNVFKNHSRISLKWKYIIYIGYQIILIFLISKLLVQINIRLVEIAAVSELSSILSKLAVTPITMMLNFIVMKTVIEKL